MLGMIPMMLIRFAIVLSLAFPAPQDMSTAPEHAGDAAICRAPDVDSLRFLGYSRKTRSVPYRHAATGVPNSSMKGEPYDSVLFMSRSGRKAVLLFVFRLPDGRIEAMHDGYFMRKTLHGWEASEGNGGPGMYERVEKFVTSLEQTPKYSLDLTIEAPARCIEESDYEEHE
jgi:hypothetical protein